MKKDFKNFVMLKSIIIIFLFSSFSCSESPTEPEKIKDPREYVWSVDTIKYPEEDGVVQSLIGSIWGSNEKDVYITGHSDSGNRIFHYNGSKWEVIDENINNIRPSFNGEWIAGFGGNDIWIAGIVQATYGTQLYPKQVAALLHYNGFKWLLEELPVEGKFSYVWGKSSSNLWACGLRGLVGHYDGKGWTIDSIRIGAGNDSFIIQSIIEYNNTPYALGFKAPVVYFFEKDIEKWQLVDSVETTNATDYPFGSHILFITKNNKLWSYGYKGVWEYNGDNSWTKIITIENGVTGLTEYTDGKYILTDPYGKIFHYDGVNLEEIKDLKERVYEVWANSKESFVVVNKPGGGIYSSTLIYHGK